MLFSAAPLLHAHTHAIPLAPIHTAGEEGDYFEGNMVADDDVILDGSASGPLPAEYYSQRVWPNGRIPYRFKPSLGKPRILL